MGKHALQRTSGCAMEKIWPKEESLKSAAHALQKGRAYRGDRVGSVVVTMVSFSFLKGMSCAFEFLSWLVDEHTHNAWDFVG